MMVAERSKISHERTDECHGQAVDAGSQADSKRYGGLVLARQLGEKLMIGDSIMIEVLGLKANSVRLRIVAPRSVTIHRREVFDAIRFTPRTPVEATEPDPTALPLEGALVLTRRTGQTIMIGGEVAVDVVEARPGTVRLRVIAPRSVSVHRREVYDAIQLGTTRANDSIH